MVANTFSNNPTTPKKATALVIASTLMLFTVFVAIGTNSDRHSSYALTSTFNAPQNISLNSGTSALAHTAIVGTNLYTVWTDNTGGNQEILFAKSADGGAHFGTSLNISNNAGQSISPQIAAYDNTIFVVWADNTGGNQEILFAKSADGGNSFTAPANLSNTPGYSSNPQLAASGNNVYVVWTDNSNGNLDVYLAKSIDAGSSFATINLSNNSGYSYTPQIAASGNNVYVVWTDNSNGNLDVYLAKSIDAGSSFATINLSNNPGIASDPQIVAYNSSVYVVYSEDGLGGSPDIYFVSSADGGNSFTAPVDLSNTNGYSYTPQIAASGNNVYVVWTDNDAVYGDGKQPFNVYLKRSANGGVSFAGLQNLSDPALANSAIYTAYEKIAVSGSAVYVVWQGTSSAAIQLDIFKAQSTDGGVTFSASTNLSNSVGQSYLPNVVASTAGAFVTWQDNTGGNFDVYSTNNIAVFKYTFGGYLPPINPDGTSVFKQGSTVPVKFQLKDSTGSLVSGAKAYLYVAKITNHIVGNDIEAVSTSSATTGNQFMYSNNQYIFNLGTKNLSPGTWQLKATLDDGSSYAIIISLKK
jgi:hypothetical protein